MNASSLNAPGSPRCRSGKHLKQSAQRLFRTNWTEVLMYLNLHFKEIIYNIYNQCILHKSSFYLSFVLPVVVLKIHKEINSILIIHIKHVRQLTREERFECQVGVGFCEMLQVFSDKIPNTNCSYYVLNGIHCNSAPDLATLLAQEQLVVTSKLNDGGTQRRMTTSE